MKWLGWIVAALTVAVVVALALWDWQENVAPGPLHASHASVRELQGNDGCAACHGRRGDMTTACEACHDEIAQQRRRGRGLHGALGDAAATCAACHVEHMGDALALVAPISFAAAGVAEPDAYDHRHLAGFPLDGAHAALDCTQCHPNAHAPALAPGERRYLGLETRCTACHEDPHRDAYGADCASCHGQVHAFDRVAAFVHLESFPLDGAHARACLACHEPDGPHGIAALQATPDAPVRACAACHDSPHDARFTSAFAPAAPVHGRDACAECHDATRDGFAGDAALLPDGAHDATGFPLVDPHADLACAQCHPALDAAGAPLDFAARFPGRTPDACVACHGDPHAGQFDDGPSAGRCVACHAATHFVPSVFALAEHERTDFPLGGAHADAACAACHEAHPDRPTRFAGLETACTACHDDPHRGQFDDGPTRGACLACHTDAHFAPSTFDLARHADTALPLTGAHTALDCAACHADDGTGARPFAGVDPACAACHEDPHRGQFDDGPTRGACMACHSDAHFAPSAFGLARHADTAFPLRGGHEAVGCDRCHRRTGDGDDACIAFAGTPTDCAACHDDPHRGLFDGADRPASVRGRVGCARCHADADPSFAGVHFAPEEHGAWTDYHLEGAHADAACRDCHRPDPRAADPRRRAFGAAPRDCAACHADPHAGQFVADGRNDCARCHDVRGFALPDFDHARTRFALDDTHAALDCAACHRPAAGGVVRYRPLGTRCQDCHGFGPGGRP